jgi:hypothetical protein
MISETRQVEGAMKKPVNKFAVFLWIVAGITAFADLVEIWTLSASFAHVSHDGASYLFSATAARLLTGMLVQVAELAGIGAVIELIDHIRWDAKHRS